MDDAKVFENAKWMQENLEKELKTFRDNKEGYPEDEVGVRYSYADIKHSFPMPGDNPDEFGGIIVDESALTDMTNRIRMRFGRFDDSPRLPGYEFKRFSGSQ